MFKLFKQKSQTKGVNYDFKTVQNNYTKDYGISYDEFWYRDIGFAVLNFLGENLFPEKLLEIKKSRNLNYLPLQGVLDVAPIGFKIQHTIYSTIEYLFLVNQKKKMFS